MIWSDSQKIVLPIALIIVVFITILLVQVFKNKNDKVKQIPFIIIATIMLVMEIIKQYLSLHDYSLWNIPLHFCSTFMLWYALAGFFKGKTSEIGFTLGVLFGFLFLALFYINPSSIISNSSDNIFFNFFSFHTFIYHHLIILFTLLAIFLNKFKPNLKKFKYVALIYTLYALIAIMFANLLEVNFTNLLHSNISFMQDILEKWGKVIYTIIMYFVGLFGLGLGMILSLVFDNLKYKKTNKDKIITKEVKL